LWRLLAELRAMTSSSTRHIPILVRGFGLSNPLFGAAGNDDRVDT
jgi:hypothetical protein